MAVENSGTAAGTSASTGRRFLVGTNVLVATALVIGIVVVAQLIAYHSNARFDMTSSGVNSLSEGTENLLGTLDQNVRLTSLYFETDREDDDQPQYRRAVKDLLDLYESTNRSQIRSEWVNPLKDHEAFSAMLARLREKPSFNKEIDAYKEKIEKFTGDLHAQLQTLIQTELDIVASSGPSLGGAAPDPIYGQLENAFSELSAMLEQTREDVGALTTIDAAQYSRATGLLQTYYTQFTQTMKNISQFGTEQAQRNPTLPADKLTFLTEAGNRYADLVATLEAEKTALQGLEPPKFDDLTAQLAKTSNAMLVETDDDARVVDFTSVWPSIQEGNPNAGFEDRAFKGEEKLTSAILRTTHKEQTAVIFVRYGGGPLFSGAMMMGQQPGPYVQMKQQLEDANFVIEEWDLKSTTTPPAIDPAPTRTIFVVLNPSPPQRGPMGQPSQEPPFSDSQRQAFLDALGENGRALFVAGWFQGPFGPIPGNYEYKDYLKDTWGVTVNSKALMVETTSTAPGEYRVARQDFYVMRDVSVTDHDIVSGALAREVGLPICAPLEIAESAPEGVDIQRLIYLAQRDGLWGETNLPGFIQLARTGDAIPVEEDDPKGPFDLAVAATKGDAKIVVVSSAQFAVDQVAFARALAMTSRGFTIRTQNPGNLSLFINSLHWLNDNTEFMNIGRPIEAAVLQVGSESTVRTVQALVIFAWPALAMVGGGLVWWVRRR